MWEVHLAWIVAISLSGLPWYLLLRRSPSRHFERGARETRRHEDER